MKWFRRHKCPTPPLPSTDIRTRVSDSVHLGEGSRLEVTGHRIGDYSPMAWIRVTVTDADDEEGFELSIHFPDMKSYAKVRDRLGLREQIGSQWVGEEDEDDDDPGT